MTNLIKKHKLFFCVFLLIISCSRGLIIERHYTLNYNEERPYLFEYHNSKNIVSNFEWKFYASLNSFSPLAYLDKDVFNKDHKIKPEDYYFYDLLLVIWIDTQVDSILTTKEKRDICVDSIKVDYGYRTKKFTWHKTFEDSKANITRNAPLFENGHSTYYKYRIDKFSKEFGFISPTIKKVRIKIYGNYRKNGTDLEPFQNHLILRLVDEINRPPNWLIDLMGGK